MRIMWVLTVLRIVTVGATGVAVHAPAPRAMQTTPVTIGIYASKVECDRMRAQLAHVPGLKRGSAQCSKQAI